MALGSTIATVVLSKDVALLEGVVALVVLVLLQVGTEWVSRRSVPARTLLEGTPTLLLYEGRIIQPARSANMA